MTFREPFFPLARCKFLELCFRIRYLHQFSDRNIKVMNLSGLIAEK